jgi:hypothetical protein
MLVQQLLRRQRERGRRSGLRRRRRPRGECRYEHFWGRRSVAERGMGADGIVMTASALDDDLRLLERGEDFAVEQLGAQRSIEGFDVAVLPRAIRDDVSRRGADRGDLVLQCLGHELRPTRRSLSESMFGGPGWFGLIMSGNRAMVPLVALDGEPAISSPLDPVSSPLPRLPVREQVRVAFPFRASWRPRLRRSDMALPFPGREIATRALLAELLENQVRE